MGWIGQSREGDGWRGGMGQLGKNFELVVDQRRLSGHCVWVCPE